MKRPKACGSVKANGLVEQSGSRAGAGICAYEDNGDVVALVNLGNSTETARYEYGPFGEPIRVSGPAAALNPFRFSTKRTCNTTELVLYEYRAYSPALGRWLSRDPIMESGVWNLYAMVLNDPVGKTDFYGLRRIEHWVQDQWTTLYVDVINKIGGTRYITYGHYLLVWGESVNGRKFHAFGKDSAEGRFIFAHFPASYRLTVSGPITAEKDAPCPIQCVGYTSEYIAFIGIKTPYIDLSFTLASSTISITICADGEIIVR
jgi:RHS repeat-associated protein